jgi:hypothetical protein
MSRRHGSTAANRASSYEAELKAAITDQSYQLMCQKYATDSGRSKPVKARLIATETALPIPAKVKEILMWVCDAEPPSPHQTIDASRDPRRDLRE